MSLKVWLPLDGDLRNLGASDIEITNNGATVDNAGKIGKCYSFDGSNDYITITYSNFPAILAKNFSIAFWVYSDDDGTRSIYFGNYGLSGSGNWFNLEKHTANEIRFWWNNGNPDKRFNSTKILSSDGWTHLTLTKNEGIIKTYLNGQLIETYINESLSSAIPSTATIFRIGGDYRTSGDLMFKGKMNDFRLYDHCLSVAEVKEIAKGLVLHYKLDGFMGGVNDNYIVNSNAFNGTTNWGNWGTATNRSVETINNKKWFHFIATAGSSAYGGFYQDQNKNLNQMSIKPNTNYTISALMFASDITQMRFWLHMRSTEGGANISQLNKTFSITTTPTVYTFTFNTGSNDNYTINRFNLMIGAAYENSTDHEVYFTDVKFEEGTKATSWVLNSAELGIDTTIIEDSSGYGHNGTILNTVTTSSDTPRYNNSTSLVADNSAINCGRGGMVTDSITVNFWLKSSGWGNPVSCTEGGGWNFEASGDYFRFPVYISGVGYKYYASTVKRTDLCNNQWHMLTGIYDRLNGHIKIYVDGELNTDFNAETTNVIGYNGTNVIWLGAEASGSATAFAGKGMKGLFSDFRIYCTPLLDTDIKLLYNMGSRVDNLGEIHSFELNEKQSNLFRSELIAPLAKNDETSGIGEIIEKNNEYCMCIKPRPFWKNLENDESALLKDCFQENTSYIFDMWMDLSEKTAQENYSAGGFYIYYTDGSRDGTFALSGQEGWQHNKLITPSDKTIEKISVRYNNNVSVLYRLDSFICKADNIQIMKNGMLNNTNIIERNGIASFSKGGNIYSSEFIEI